MIVCSVVIPLLNEQESIPELYTRLKVEMEKLVENSSDQSFELIFVDDGSTDDTFKLLRELAVVDSRVIGIRFRKRYGKTAALVAGFRRAQGRYIVTMDGDLQHNPEDIGRFIEKLDEGYDIVCGWREKRVDNVWLRRIPSRIANRLMRRLSRVDLDDFGGGFKAYRASVLREVSIYGGMQRFIPALASARGARMCQIPIKNIPRRFGSSRYGISRAVPVFFDLLRIHFLLTYLQQPLRFFGTIGLVLLSGGLADGLWLAIERLIYHQHIVDEHGPLLLVAAILIVTGVQLLMLGLIGEMVVWFFNQNQDGQPKEYAIAEMCQGQNDVLFEQTQILR
ncbi:MAG TPA: glycosyltransferase family 2 protein [Edaphobacter sp.]|nr:glycosyltransferase family 2 protein [Edaphobacter sp.]